ncbi:MAG: B12-binding domain-containing radical SAM protein [Bacteriovoracaceae bacterium]|mgnify:CR=1 FL=1|nr:B12-binding domain-containing radical SAM protein [Bacteriovoracaceae bacterium]
MRILFVVSEIIISEPLGILLLSSICKKNGYETKLCALNQDDLNHQILTYRPDLIAYSAMTADIKQFKEFDLTYSHIFKELESIRIMGGAHPTYFPDILDEMLLDAICIGEGDNAISRICDKIIMKRALTGIPNVISKEDRTLTKELIKNLDTFPLPDRDILYQARPHYKLLGLRSVLTARGCAFKCSYCYVHSFNKMFKGLGDTVRRRDPVAIINELKLVIESDKNTRLIRFADDTFIYSVDEWFLEFSKLYKNEINLPFYCLMRSNTFTEEIARILSEMGCISVGMSIESGNAQMRSKILKRYIPDKTILESFRLAKKYHINTYANSMIALPGGSFKEDLITFRFSRDLKVSAPTFSIFCPYPGLELTDYALENNYLNPDYNYENKYGSPSVLNGFTDQEKRMQVRLQHLGPLFCVLPRFFTPLLLLLLLKLPLTSFYHKIGAIFEVFILSTRVFKNIYPRNPFVFLRIAYDSISYAHKSDVKTDNILPVREILTVEGGANRDVKRFKNV